MVASEYIVQAQRHATVIENVERVSLYVDDELKAKLEARAAKNHRSLNGEIITVLERCLESEEVNVPKRTK